tara:strand:+ start:10616 stop:10738 length:123 start_codon:yes stop_codon:yes gene_type:complete
MEFNLIVDIIFLKVKRGSRIILQALYLLLKDDVIDERKVP